MSNTICTSDLIGSRSGKLCVICLGDPIRDSKGRSHRTLVCRCDCGKETTVRLTAFRIGNSRSCGCKRKESIAEASTTHGMTGSGTYVSWHNMIQRGKGKACPKHYHDRGIRVCERWNTFENFLDDMGVRPEGMTLDRIDNNKGYSPSNCRWVTPYEQSRNTRNNVWLNVEGKKMCITDAAKTFGLNLTTVIRRRNKGRKDLFVPVLKPSVLRKEHRNTYNTWVRLRSQNREDFCKRWLSFEKFIEDMGPRPKGLVFWRVNPKIKYCPSNCKWVDREQRNRNISTTVWVTYKGKKMCLSQAARAAGLKLSTVTQRRRRGHDLFAPLKH